MVWPTPPPVGVYPGTTRPLGPPAASALYHGAFSYWDNDPIFKRQQGYLREFFGIGHLGAALMRSPKTIYKWERLELFPKATYIYNGGSRHGQRRLYTRQQIDGVIQIAADEGILHGSKRYIGETLFPSKCADLFRATKGVLPPPINEGTPHD
jgi:hypothetical protein